MSEYIGEDTKAVLFDFDDTLVGTIKPKWAQHKHVARQFYDKEITDEQLAEHWGKPLPALVCALYETDDADRALANNYSCHEDFPKELFEATIPTLYHLRTTGRLMLLGVVTATTRFSFEHDITLLGIPRVLLDYTQTVDDTPHYKPDPRVFDPTLAWLDDLHIRPDEVTYVGDGLLDMNAAVGAGFNFVGVETGLTTAKQFAAAGAVSVPGIANLVTTV